MESEGGMPQLDRAEFAGAAGLAHCAVCGNHLFRSDAKFASSCGWPSFYEAIRPNSVTYKEDNSHGMKRVEVTCGRCDSHLGHIFDDGPPPTHKRFCMNSVSLSFVPEGEPLPDLLDRGAPEGEPLA